MAKAADGQAAGCFPSRTVCVGRRDVKTNKERVCSFVFGHLSLSPEVVNTDGVESGSRPAFFVFFCNTVSEMQRRTVDVDGSTGVDQPQALQPGTKYS